MRRDAPPTAAPVCSCHKRADTFADECGASLRDCAVSQLSSSVLMGIDASPEGRCATAETTVRTGLMRWTVRGCPRAATTAATQSAVYRKASCAMVRGTAPMARMKRGVVSDEGMRLK